MTEWISVKDRVPAVRKNYFIWGDVSLLGGIMRRNRCLGISKYNPGDAFDISKTNFSSIGMCYKVTHWAEIVGPK